MKGVHPKVTFWKVRNTLKRSGLSADMQQMILAKLGHKKALENREVKLKRKDIARLEKVLNADRKAGLLVSKKGRIYILTGKMCKFNFNIGNLISHSDIAKAKAKKKLVNTEQGLIHNNVPALPGQYQ